MHGKSAATVSENLSDNRWQYIDALRALSVYCIVLAHCFPMHEQFFLRKIIYIFHVPLFFVLSGYVMDVERQRSLKEILSNRFKSIGIPFLVCVALLDPLYYRLAHKHLSIQKYSSDLTFFDGHLSFVYLWTMWLLPALFIGWLGCYVLLKYVKGFWQQAGIGVACLIISYFASAKSNFDTPLPHVLVYFGFLRLFAVIPFLMLGFWLKKYDVIGLSSRTSWFVILGCLAAAIAIGYDLQPVITINRYIYGNFFLLFIAASAASIALLLIAVKIGSYPKPILFFGQNTIIVLALHHWVVIYAADAMDLPSFSKPVAIGLSFVLSIALTTALLGVVYAFKQMPLANMLMASRRSRTRNRDTSVGIGALHVEKPTREMISAGVDALNLYADSYDRHSLAEAVYSAMKGAQPLQP